VVARHGNALAEVPRSKATEAERELSNRTYDAVTQPQRKREHDDRAREADSELEHPCRALCLGSDGEGPCQLVSIQQSDGAQPLLHQGLLSLHRSDCADE